MGKGEDALDVLRSIDASLKQLVALSRVAKPKEVASDHDLDSQYGDPIVKAADPRDWPGPPQKGKHFSECSSEYLMLVADRLDFFADKAERENTLTSGGKPVAPYNRRDAARARGWAARVRAGRGRQQEPSSAGDAGSVWSGESASPFPDTVGGFEDDIPF